MSVNYRLKSNLTFPCTISQLSFAILHHPFKNELIRATRQPDRLGLDVTEIATGEFVYQTVNTLTRLNLHQPARVVFNKTVLRDDYHAYISDDFHLTTRPHPALTMDKTQYMKLFRRLMHESLYSEKRLEYPITPSMVKSIQGMVFRATDFFTQNQFIESNISIPTVGSKSLRGGIGDYLCEDGIFAVRTLPANTGLIHALTHVLIQTLLCQMSDKYRYFPFQRVGVYNAYLNTVFEYNFDDVDEGFIEFIQDIYKKGKKSNGDVKIL